MQVGRATCQCRGTDTGSAGAQTAFYSICTPAIVSTDLAFIYTPCILSTHTYLVSFADGVAVSQLPSPA